MGSDPYELFGETGENMSTESIDEEPKVRQKPPSVTDSNEDFKYYILKNFLHKHPLARKYINEMKTKLNGKLPTFDEMKSMYKFMKKCEKMLLTLKLVRFGTKQSMHMINQKWLSEYFDAQQFIDKISNNVSDEELALLCTVAENEQDAMNSSTNDKSTKIITYTDVLKSTFSNMVSEAFFDSITGVMENLANNLVDSTNDDDDVVVVDSDLKHEGFATVKHEDLEIELADGERREYVTKNTSTTPININTNIDRNIPSNNSVVNDLSIVTNPVSDEDIKRMLTVNVETDDMETDDMETDDYLPATDLPDNSSNTVVNDISTANADHISEYHITDYHINDYHNSDNQHNDHSSDHHNDGNRNNHQSNDDSNVYYNDDKQHNDDNQDNDYHRDYMNSGYNHDGDDDNYYHNNYSGKTISNTLISEHFPKVKIHETTLESWLEFNGTNGKRKCRDVSRQQQQQLLKLNTDQKIHLDTHDDDNCEQNKRDYSVNNNTSPSYINVEEDNGNTAAQRHFAENIVEHDVEQHQHDVEQHQHDVEQHQHDVEQHQHDVELDEHNEGVVELFSNDDSNNHDLQDELNQEYLVNPQKLRQMYRKDEVIRNVTQNYTSIYNNNDVNNNIGDNDNCAKISQTHDDDDHQHDITSNNCNGIEVEEKASEQDDSNQDVKLGVLYPDSNVSLIANSLYKLPTRNTSLGYHVTKYGGSSDEVELQFDLNSNTHHTAGVNQDIVYSGGHNVVDSTMNFINNDTVPLDETTQSIQYSNRSRTNLKRQHSVEKISQSHNIQTTNNYGGQQKSHHNYFPRTTNVKRTKKSLLYDN